VKISKAGLDLIKHFEQCRLAAFKPILTDPWTIGWGRTKGVEAGDTCTQAQADEWLVEDVSGAAMDVTRSISVPLSQHQFDALTSFVYNCGGPALWGSTLRKLLNDGHYEAAADQFKRWDKSKGVPLAGLARRRAAEARLFRTPDGEEFVL
jgi:lysozyme